MNSIILTGASGFIGTDLLRELKNEYNVLAIGRNFKKYDDKIYYLIDDLNNIRIEEVKQKLPNLTSNIFIHAAGQAHIVQTAETMHLFNNNNVKATENALDIAMKTGADKFIFVSSIAVENDNPEDVYGKTKKEAEILIKDFCTKHHMNYIIIRPAVVYGESDRKGNVQKLINQMRRGIFPLFNNGHTTKSMIYVKNLSYMIKELIESDKYNNNTFIARDKDELTLKEICIGIKKNVNKPVLLLPVPSIVLGMIIFFLKTFQKSGILKSINVKSLQNLNSQTTYELDELNKELVEYLPYSIYEGLANTVSEQNQ